MTVLREAWLATMRDHKDGERFLLLPSEAAAIVARTFGVRSVDVLLALAPDEGRAALATKDTPS